MQLSSKRSFSGYFIALWVLFFSIVSNCVFGRERMLYWVSNFLGSSSVCTSSCSSWSELWVPKYEFSSASTTTRSSSISSAFWFLNWWGSNAFEVFWWKGGAGKEFCSTWKTQVEVPLEKAYWFSKESSLLISVSSFYSKLDTYSYAISLWM